MTAEFTNSNYDIVSRDLRHIYSGVPTTPCFGTKRHVYASDTGGIDIFARIREEQTRVRVRKMPTRSFEYMSEYKAMLPSAPAFRQLNKLRLDTLTYRLHVDSSHYKTNTFRPKTTLSSKRHERCLLTSRKHVSFNFPTSNICPICGTSANCGWMAKQSLYKPLTIRQTTNNVSWGKEMIDNAFTTKQSTKRSYFLECEQLFFVYIGALVCCSVKLMFCHIKCFSYRTIYEEYVTTKKRQLPCRAREARPHSYVAAA